MSELNAGGKPPQRSVLFKSLSGVNSQFQQMQQREQQQQAQLNPPVVRNQNEIQAVQTIPNQNYPADISQFASVEDKRKAEKKIQRSNIRIRQRAYKSSLGALDVLTITGINFSILSDEEIDQLEAVEVKNPNKQGPGSLYDPKMGATKDHICGVCQMDNQYCRGHIGYISLADYIYHPELIHNVIFTLMCVCHSCSRLLVDVEWMKRNRLFEVIGTARLKMLANKIAKRACRFGERDGMKCSPNPASYDAAGAKSTGRIAVFMNTGQAKESQPTVLNIRKVRTIISNISLTDVELMGFNAKRNAHPKNLIRKHWPVMPPCARSPKTDNYETVYDRIDDQYKHILDINDELRRLMNNTDSDSIVKRDKFSSQLYVAIGELATGPSKDSRNTFTCLKDCLEKKNGIPRKHIMSSKQPLSLRLVITPDPKMKIGELRVPQYAKRLLTREVKVTVQNMFEIEKLKEQDLIEFVEDGQTGVLRRYRLSKEPSKIKIGDTVVRQLMNGDYVMFVRQPVLLKVGFMGYRVRICVDPRTMTFGFNLANTVPHHADYDGDEMTAFSIMSDQVKFLAGATENIISNITGRPIYGLTYNALSSMHILTKEDRIFSYAQFFNFLQGTSVIINQPIIPPPTKIKPPTIHFNNKPPPPGGFINYYGTPKRNDPELSQYWSEYDKWAQWKYPVQDGSKLNAEDAEVKRWLDGNTLFARAYKLGVRDFTLNKMLFSAILPNKLNYSAHGVIIKNGILLRGVLDVYHLGNGAQTISQVIYDLYQQVGLLERQRTIRFLDDAYILGDNFMCWRGMSMGLTSVTPKVTKPAEPKENAPLSQILRQIDQQRAQRTNDKLELQTKAFNPYTEVSETIIAPLIKYVQLGQLNRSKIAFDELVQVLPALPASFTEAKDELILLLQKLWPNSGPSPRYTAPIERNILKILNRMQKQLDDIQADKSVEQLRENELNKLQQKLDELGPRNEDPFIEAIRQDRKTLVIQGYGGRMQQLLKSGEVKMQSPELETMIAAGSKGNVGSLAQMSLAGYQQFRFGERHSANLEIPGLNYTQSNRLFPYAPLGRTDEETRNLNDRYEYEGGISRPFIKELSLSEALSTAPPARDSAINTNLDVSRTGYQQRKLATTTMDTIVSNELTVRKVTTESETPSIVSWYYGDGLRVDKTIEVKIGDKLYKSVIDLESWTAEYNRTRGYDGTSN